LAASLYAWLFSRAFFIASTHSCVPNRIAILTSS
jgi:hypothetical protein